MHKFASNVVGAVVVHGYPHHKESVVVVILSLRVSQSNSINFLSLKRVMENQIMVTRIALMFNSYKPPVRLGGEG